MSDIIYVTKETLEQMKIELQHLKGVATDEGSASSRCFSCAGPAGGAADPTSAGSFACTALTGAAGAADAARMGATGAGAR